MKTTFLLSAAYLLATLSPSVIEIEWGNSGPVELRYKGRQFLSRGDFLVNGVTFTDLSGGRVWQGSTHSQITTNPLTQSEVLTLDWGAVDVHYRAEGDRLAIEIGVSNKSSSILKSISLDVLALQLPSTPSQFNATNPMLGTNIGAPTVLPLDFASGSLVVANDDVTRPLLLGLPWTLNPPARTVFPIRINTGREAMYSNNLSTINRPIAPGGKDTFHISLRFSSASSSVLDSARDVIARFAGVNEFAVRWPDRRPIGSLIIATAATGWKTNPRGWLLDPTIDVTTKDGVSRFHARLLDWANNSIAILKKMGAQGMITWDIEGEEFPHATTYIGDPELCQKLAPEMAGVVDEYFQRFRSAGLRVGVTVRPQKLDSAGTPRQADASDPGAELIRKIGYAKKRWGATLFYIDSNGDPGFPISADIIKKVARTFPDVLLIPEHKNVAYFSVGAPYSESRNGSFGTPGFVTAIYPKAFSVVNTADGAVDKHAADLAAAVNRGDILMFRGWFDDPANALLKTIASQSKFKGR